VKYLVLAAIRLYWVVWPSELKRRCLYRETCSLHVYRATREGGFVIGLRALLSRVRTCRPGYTVSSETGLGLVLCDGSFLAEHLAAKDILAPIQLTITRLECAFNEGKNAPLENEKDLAVTPPTTDLT
jgi:uncharacterized protein